MSGYLENLRDTWEQDLSEAGFAYDADEDIFYSEIDCWQKEFGYCQLYDEASTAAGMVIDYEPVTFFYGGREWLIEFWKGQYGMTSGGEVGIYTASEDLLLPEKMYEGVSEEDFLEMSFSLERNGRPFFSREGRHWWLTGFRLGEFSWPEQLSMRIGIECKDEEMTEAFAAALAAKGYRDDQFTVQERRVSIRFSDPYASQPRWNVLLLQYVVQKWNRTWCSLYDYFTREHGETAEKVLFLLRKQPWLYKKVLRMGKPPRLFRNVKRMGVW